MRVYDDVDAHRAELPGDVPRKAGATHIGVFLAWCVERGLTSDWHEEHQPEAFERLARRWHSGREYLLQFLDGKLTEAHLGPAGRAFAERYYVTGRYLEDYEATLRGHRPSRYHVPDTWASVDEIAPLLDERFDAWRRERKEARAGERGAAPPPLGRDFVTPPVVDAVGEPAPAPRPEAESEPRPQPEPEVVATPAASTPFDLAPEETATPSIPPPQPATRPQPRSRPAPERKIEIPHRTKKAWHRKSGRGGGWVLLLVIALIYGCTKWTGDKAEQRARARAERRDAWLRRARESVKRNANRRFNPPLSQPVLRRAPWPTVSLQQRQAAAKANRPVQFENKYGMRFVFIPAGSFVMGSPVGEAGRHESETPHNVILSRPFYMSITEVTNAQYRRFRQQHITVSPEGISGHTAAEAPVTSVSWIAAQAFCAWLSKRDDARTYRLPTEAEWEYACRAGSAGPFPWEGGAAGAHLFANVADQAAKGGWPARVRTEVEARSDWRWFSGQDRRAGLSQVARYRPNPWGLYDMIGNVAEWCSDWAGEYDVSVVQDPRGPPQGYQRVHRGGAFDTPVRATRAAARASEDPPRYEPNLGFRVVVPLR